MTRRASALNSIRDLKIFIYYKCIVLQSAKVSIISQTGKFLPFFSIFLFIYLHSSDILTIFAPSLTINVAMGNMKQGKGKRKSLQKETFKKTIDGERHGAVAGNASAKNLNPSGNERLNRFALTHMESAAKLQQNTETAKKKVQKLINNGYIIKSFDTEVDIVRNLSKALSIRKSDSSMSYYVYYRVDEMNIKFRMSTHPANGDRMSSDSVDMGISVIVYKNGSHSSDGTIPWKEFKYELSTCDSKKVVRSIVDGLSSLLNGDGFCDPLGIAEIKEYNFFEDNTEKQVDKKKE